jgi:hypothetical protein
MSYEDDLLGEILDEDDDREHEGLSPWGRDAQKSWKYTYLVEGLKTDGPKAPSTQRPMSRSEWRRREEARMSRLMGLDPADECPICAEIAAPPPSGRRLRLTPEAAPSVSQPTRKRRKLRLV